jgi:8-oxo-dGTP pyrophosphatase MutT (NUDIX family)
MTEGSAIFLVDRQGRILLQQRDDDVPPAGYGRWAVPGGGREGDETAEETIRREFPEETAVDLDRVIHFGDFRGLVDEAAVLHAYCSNDVVPRERIEVLEGIDFQYWHPDEVDGLPLNPRTRRFIRDFALSAAYASLAGKAAPAGAGIIAIDRWGRLLVRRDRIGSDELAAEDFRLPLVSIGAAESPDSAALRGFEEETGALMPTLKLFRTYHRAAGFPNAPYETTHLYYHDADLEAETLGDGLDFVYVDPQGLPGAPLGPVAKRVLEEFLESPAYKAMFH